MEGFSAILSAPGCYCAYSNMYLTTCLLKIFTIATTTFEEQQYHIEILQKFSKSLLVTRNNTNNTNNTNTTYDGNMSVDHTPTLSRNTSGDYHKTAQNSHISDEIPDDMVGLDLSDGDSDDENSRLISNTSNTNNNGISDGNKKFNNININIGNSNSPSNKTNPNNNPNNSNNSNRRKDRVRDPNRDPYNNSIYYYGENENDEVCVYIGCVCVYMGDDVCI